MAQRICWLPSRDDLLRIALEPNHDRDNKWKDMMTSNDHADELALARAAVEHGYLLVKIHTDDLDRLEQSPLTAVYALVDVACDGGGDGPMTALAVARELDVIAEQLAERVCS